MATAGSDVPVQSAVDEQHHLRRQSIVFAEQLVDSPRLDVGVDPTLTPLGKDRELLIRFAAIDLLLAAAVAEVAVLDHTWLLAPLMALLFISLGVVVGMSNQVLSDPDG